MPLKHHRIDFKRLLMNLPYPDSRLQKIIALKSILIFLNTFKFLFKVSDKKVFKLI
jgi:hypothetical protein